MHEEACVLRVIPLREEALEILIELRRCKPFQALGRFAKASDGRTLGPAVALEPVNLAVESPVCVVLLDEWFDQGVVVVDYAGLVVGAEEVQIGTDSSVGAVAGKRLAAGGETRMGSRLPNARRSRDTGPLR